MIHPNMNKIGFKPFKWVIIKDETHINLPFNVIKGPILSPTPLSKHYLLNIVSRYNEVYEVDGNYELHKLTSENYADKLHDVPFKYIHGESISDVDDLTPPLPPVTEPEPELPQETERNEIPVNESHAENYEDDKNVEDINTEKRISSNNHNQNSSTHNTEKYKNNNYNKNKNNGHNKKN